MVALLAWGIWLTSDHPAWTVLQDRLLGFLEWIKGTESSTVWCWTAYALAASALFAHIASRDLSPPRVRLRAFLQGVVAGSIVMYGTLLLLFHSDVLWLLVGTFAGITAAVLPSMVVIFTQPPRHDTQEED